MYVSDKMECESYEHSLIIILSFSNSPSQRVGNVIKEILSTFFLFNDDEDDDDNEKMKLLFMMKKKQLREERE